MPVRAGFRAILRQPKLILAEIAWRWAFGAAAWILIVLTMRHILARMDVSEAEYLISRHSDVFLIADSVSRILIQALPAFARACIVLVPAISAIWLAAATLGRAATLKALLKAKNNKRPSMGALLELNFLRVILTLASGGALVGATFLAGSAVPADPSHPAAVIIVLLLLFALVAMLWQTINWFLALAPIWIVRDGRGTLRAIDASLALFRGKPAAYMAAASWFGLLRGLWLLAAFFAGLIAASVPLSNAAAVAACVVLTLVYLAGADLLQIARLAAFVELNENSQPAAISIQPVPPAPAAYTEPDELKADS